MFKIVLAISLLGVVFGQQCTFEANVDYFGNDLSASPCFVKSLDECCALCSKVPQCAAWTYQPSICACWIKYSVTERRTMSDGRFSGCRQNIFFTQPTLPPTHPPTLPPTHPPTCPCKEQQNVNFPGCDLKEQGNVSCSAECCQLCRQTYGCVAFAYYSTYKHCYLKSAVGTGLPQSLPGMIYGVL
ncbi:unnamed protein product [Brachionus calyciflorus]|uniref:Apple domain-containing protein n=1 Tax=Brachionus calyciflorus TaxID=104777 RepID=A0A813UWH1_9BILA|nr:unnamed protein product [Brachionus calyciflorus]